MSGRQQQYSLFGGDYLADVTPLLKAAMSASIKDTDLSIDQTADRMQALAERSGLRINRNAKRLSKETLEKWINPNDTTHIPSLNAIQAFVLALGDPRPLAVLAEAYGMHVITEEQARLLKAAEIDAEIARLKAQKKRLGAP
jgi:hypothetical protein